eukprot:313695-Amphidinium_carterae.2
MIPHNFMWFRVVVEVVPLSAVDLCIGNSAQLLLPAVLKAVLTGGKFGPQDRMTFKSVALLAILCQEVSIQQSPGRLQVPAHNLDRLVR